jgi:hypothetical protein
MRICEIGVLETDRLGEALSRPHVRVSSWCAVESVVVRMSRISRFVAAKPYG